MRRRCASPRLRSVGTRLSRCPPERKNWPCVRTHPAQGQSLDSYLGFYMCPLVLLVGLSSVVSAGLLALALVLVATFVVRVGGGADGVGVGLVGLLSLVGLLAGLALLILITIDF